MVEKESHMLYSTWLGQFGIFTTTTFVLDICFSSNLLIESKHNHKKIFMQTIIKDQAYVIKNKCVTYPNKPHRND